MPYSEVYGYFRQCFKQTSLFNSDIAHVLALFKKAGNLRQGKAENRQAYVLEQLEPRLSLPNR
jgi:hypothetical protein